jgi:hypothetical protein
MAFQMVRGQGQELKRLGSKLLPTAGDIIAAYDMQTTCTGYMKTFAYIDFKIWKANQIYL